MRGFLTAVILLFAVVSAEARSPRIGEPVAPFSLQNLADRTIDTAQYRGTTTVLYFWNNLCGCTEQLIALKAFISARQGRNLAFVTVNEGQGKKIAESVISANRLPYQTLLDNDFKVGQKQFGIKVLPTIFIIDKQGILREKLIGVVDNRRLESIIQRHL